MLELFDQVQVSLVDICSKQSRCEQTWKQKAHGPPGHHHRCLRGVESPSVAARKLGYDP